MQKLKNLRLTYFKFGDNILYTELFTDESD